MRGVSPWRVSAVIGVIVMGVGVGGLVGTASTGAQAPAVLRSREATANCKTPVTVLFPLPYTGSENFEVGFGDAIMIPAVHAINAAGGILCHKLEPITFDDKSDAADALVAWERQFALHPNASWTGIADTTATPALLPIVTRYKMPFATAAGQATYDRITNPFFYRYTPPDPANGTAMAIWAQRHGYKRIATVFGTDPGSQGDLPGVLSAAKKIHADIVAQLNIVPDQPNYRSAVEQLIAAKPQVIMTESDGNTGATFFSELKQLGKVPPIIVTNSVATSSYVGPVAKALGTSTFERDVVGVVIGVPNPATPGYKAYASDVHAVRSRLAAPWQQWVGNVYTQNGFSVWEIMALAMDWAHSTEGSVFNRYIPMVTAPGKNKVVVHTYAEGVKALRAGKAIQYVGGLGPMVLNQYHNWFPNEAVQRFTPSGIASTIGVVTTRQIEAIQ